MPRCNQKQQPRQISNKRATLMPTTRSRRKKNNEAPVTAQPKQIQQHYSSNKKNKPFICNYYGCKKSFARKYHLKRHKGAHYTVKPFACSLCHKRFTRKDNRDRHMVNSCLKNRRRLCTIYSCMKCHKDFNRKDNRDRHCGNCNQCNDWIYKDPSVPPGKDPSLSPVLDDCF
eukprot:459367_1